MTEIAYTLSFSMLAGLTAISALLVLTLRNVLHSAVALFFALLGVAGLYVLLGADFLAAVQLLIYAGGILVLIIFGVFLTTRAYQVQLNFSERSLSKFWGATISMGVFALMAAGIHFVEWPMGTPNFEPTVASLGDLLLSKYLLPFEIVSVLLLFAMIGAIILVRKEFKEEGQ